MNEEEMLRAVELAQKQWRRDQEQRALLAEGPIAQLVKDALSAIVKPELNWLGTVRLPASIETLTDVENNIEDSLPDEIRSFYEECDGFKALSDEFPFAFWRVQDISLGKRLDPPLSEWVRLHQSVNPEREEGAPLPLFPHNDIEALATDNPAISIQPEEIDLLVVMEATDDYRRICFSTKPIGPYEVGAIVEIERCVATIYPGIKSWLAATVVMYGRK